MKLNLQPAHWVSTAHEKERKEERKKETISPRQDVRNTGTLHLEPLETPVSGRDGADKSRSNEVGLIEQGLVGVKLGGSTRLFKDLVDARFQILVERFEDIFEQERE
jgi:hypothetical protein